MWVGIATGKNEHYGKKGQKIYIADDKIKYVRKNNIAINLRRAGTGRFIIRDFDTGKEIR